MEPITSFLNSAKLAGKKAYKNLTVFPLLAPNGTKPDYLTLEEALDQNLVQITELGQAGSVPELKLRNKGKKKLLIVEGEELIGAKQNRIVNVTLLVASNTEIVIPLDVGDVDKSDVSAVIPIANILCLWLSISGFDLHIKGSILK